MNKYISEVVDYLIEEYAESVIEETTKYATEKVGKFVSVSAMLVYTAQKKYRPSFYS